MHAAMLGIALNPADVFYTEDRDFVVWLKALVEETAKATRRT